MRTFSDIWLPSQTKRLRIGMDLDGVVDNSLQDFRLYLQSRLCLEQPPPYPITEDWHKEWGMSYADLRQYYADAVNSRTIYRRYGSFYPGVVTAMQRLREDGHEVSILTSRLNWGNSYIIFDSTTKALREAQIPYNGAYFVGNDKVPYARQLNLDIHVDDSPRHYREITRIGIPVYLVDRPWNQKIDVEGLRIPSIQVLANMLHG